MTLVAEIRERLRALLSGSREDREAEEGLRFHLEMEVEENLRRGMSAAEARRAARLKLGGALQVREAMRDARGLRWLEDLAQDARYALRVLGRSPGFALVVVLLLAPSIGANAALFGLLDALVDRVPPGVEASDRLVWLVKPGPFEDASYPDYVDPARAGGGDRGHRGVRRHPADCRSAHVRSAAPDLHTHAALPADRRAARPVGLHSLVRRPHGSRGGPPVRDHADRRFLGCEVREERALAALAGRTLEHARRAASGRLRFHAERPGRRAAQVHPEAALAADLRADLRRLG